MIIQKIGRQILNENKYSIIVKFEFDFFRFFNIFLNTFLDNTSTNYKLD